MKVSMILNKKMAAKKVTTTNKQSKDQVTKWRKEIPNLQIRTRAHNIVIQLPGPKGVARNKKFIIDSINLFLNGTIIGVITTCTNIFIRDIRQQFQRDRNARETDEVYDYDQEIVQISDISVAVDHL